jgi:hypothetical protein
MDEFIDDVIDTAERVGEFAEGLVDVAADSFTHSARGVEASLDTDKDGSLIDNLLSAPLGDVPFVGSTLQAILGTTMEEIGDFATDAAGTRKHGVFSEMGTLDVKATTDDDYKGDGSFAGVGDYINRGGDGPNIERNPADILQLAAEMAGKYGPSEVAPGAQLAADANVGEALKKIQEHEDPYLVTGDATSPKD